MATPSIAPRSAQSGLFNQSLSVRVNLRVSGGICKASWRLAVQPCLPNGVAYSRQRATRCFAHSLGPWHHGSGRRVAPNNSFKPNLLRYGNGVAEVACHAVACTAQVGLTRALNTSAARSWRLRFSLPIKAGSADCPAARKHARKAVRSGAAKLALRRRPHRFSGTFARRGRACGGLIEPVGSSRQASWALVSNKSFKPTLLRKAA